MTVTALQPRARFSFGLTVVSHPYSIVSEVGLTLLGREIKTKNRHATHKQKHNSTITHTHVSTPSAVTIMETATTTKNGTTDHNKQYQTPIGLIKKDSTKYTTAPLLLLLHHLHINSPY
jgi:hypothetical protein